MKLFKFQLLICAFLFPIFVTAQIENVIVEKYYISDDFDALDTIGGKLPAGSTTYRIFIDLPQGSKLMKIYGDNNHEFSIKSTKPFFNNKADGQTFGKDIAVSRYQTNTVALDSWLTLGQIAKTVPGNNYFGVLKTDDTDGSFVGGKNNDGGSMKLPFGLLNNVTKSMGIPLTKADGITTSSNTPSSWQDYGIKDFFTKDDSTVFGSLKIGNSFRSRNFALSSSGVMGVDTIKNQVLIAQITTEGEISFSLNVEVLENTNGIPTKVQYVSNDSILLKNTNYNEKYSGFLNFPVSCGCTDPNFLEYNPKLVCSETNACKTPIVIGCTDTMACNFDPKANVMVHNLCCYPGQCNDRDISQVCPSLQENDFTFEIQPNPTNDYIFLNATTGSNNDFTYELFNAYGQSVLKVDLGKVTKINNEKIDLRNLENGLYHLRMIVGDKIKSTLLMKY